LDWKESASGSERTGDSAAEFVKEGMTARDLNVPYQSPDAALTTLNAHIRECIANRDSTSKRDHSIAVLGVVSGVGKTRLLHESHRAAIPHVRVYITMNGDMSYDADSEPSIAAAVCCRIIFAYFVRRVARRGDITWQAVRDGLLGRYRASFHCADSLLMHLLRLVSEHVLTVEPFTGRRTVTAPVPILLCIDEYTRITDRRQLERLWTTLSVVMISQDVQRLYTLCPIITGLLLRPIVDAVDASQVSLAR
jgi:hypothetical protein